MSGTAELELESRTETARRCGEGRFERVLASVRRRQLASALEGRVTDSARYARRARRVREMCAAEL
jgi:hypothetical protein